MRPMDRVSAVPAEAAARLPTRQEWVWIALAAFTAAALRLAVSDVRGYWLDEYYTLQAAAAPLRAMIPERLGAGHSPLPFLYAKVFYLLFGNDEIPMRASSALACGVAVAGLALLALELGLRFALAPLLVLAVFQPYWMWIGTLLRYMMPMVAVATLWAWATARHLRAPTWRGGLLAFFLGALTLWTHATAQFIWLGLTAFAVIVAWRGVSGPAMAADGAGGRLRRVVISVAPLAASWLSALPLLLLLGKEADTGRPEWNFNMERSVKTLTETMFGENKLWTELTGLSNDLFVAVGLLLFVAAGVLCVRRLRREGGHAFGAFLASTLLGLILAVQLYTVLVADDLRPVRYVAFGSVPVTLAMAVAWAEARALPRVRWGFQACTALLVGGGFLLHGVNRGDWQRETLLWLSEVRRPEEPVVAVSSRINLYAMEVLNFPARDNVTGIPSTGADVESTTAHLRRAFAQCDLGFIFQYYGNDVPVDASVQRLLSQGFAVDTRQWRAGAARVIGVARTAQGAARLKAMPEIPQPAIAIKTH